MLQENRCNPIQSGFYTFDSSGLSSPYAGKLDVACALSHIQFAAPRTLGFA